ncbi:MAG: FlgO family outer membrane protein [bacterium]
MTDNRDNDKTQTHIALTKGTMVSHYRIIEKIGAGGMGEVYLSEDTKLKRQVALKFLPPQFAADKEFKARFTREAQAAAALKHPNIVTIYDVSEFQGRPFFAMEHVEGQSLGDHIKNNELDLDSIIDLALGICGGLCEAHEAGVTHRDIKPANIILDKKGQAKLVDFGLAAVQGGEQLTQTGSTLGTIGYMSLEQVLGKEIDHRSDLFSLGVVLYELITKQNPFKRDSEAATLKAVSDDTPEPLARYKTDVPDDLQRIVSKLLEKDPRFRYQSAADVVSDLKRLRRDSQPGMVLESGRAPSRRIKRFLVPALVLVVAVAVLVLKPWKFEFQPTEEAVAAENRLAIMYFDNLADPEDSLKLGEIATNLLIADLSESQYVQVVSSQRLYDILKLLGREGEKKIARDMATQIAEKARARWMLLGSILQVEPQIIVMAQLVEVESGNAIASQRITGSENENIFAVIDSMTLEIKSDLSLPVAALTEVDRPVADVTTHSPEAYRYYLEGVDIGYKFYMAEAKQLFEKAVELDSTFAMAYYRLAGLSSRAEREEYRQKAMKYSEKASHKERLYILGFDAYLSGELGHALEMLEEINDRYPDDKEAYFTAGYLCQYGLGDFHRAIEYLRKAIEVDSLYGVAYNSLAYSYNEIGNLESSIWAINKYIDLSPGEANPYDTRGELYALNGKLEKAIESYEKALEIRPDFYASRRKLAYMYLFARRYDKAEGLYRELCADSNADRRSLGRKLLSYIPIYQGKFKEALTFLDDAIAAVRLEQDDPARWSFQFKRADIYQARNELKMALKEVEKIVENYAVIHPDDSIRFRHVYAVLLAQNGDSAKAQKEVESLRLNIEKNDPSTMWAYWYAVGSIEFYRGDFEQSVVNLEKAAEDVQYLHVNYMLGRAYLMSGRLGESVSQFEKTINRYDAARISVVTMAVKIHYYLGQAYEASGWNEKAIEQYETFLDIWKDADEGIESVEDARAKLARLTIGS